MSDVTLQSNGRYWQARWYDGRGKKQGKSLGAKSRLSRRAALRKCRELQAGMQTGRVASGKSPTLSEHTARFLANRTDLGEGTRELYKHTIRYLANWFNPRMRIAKITRKAAADWRAAIARGELSHLNTYKHEPPSESTVCRHVREAKCIFQMAVDEDLIPFNPFGKIKGTAPIPDKTWAYVNRSMMKRLLNVCPTEGWRLLLALCRLGGLRQGEAMRLRWSDVDQERRRLIVNADNSHQTTKRKRREVPIVPELYDLLFEVWMKGEAGEYVVPREDLPRGNIWRGFGVICEKAKVQRHDRWCHTLRKNCETDWLEKFPAPDVCEWLGHGPTIAAKHYHKARDESYEAAAGLDRKRTQKRTQTGPRKS